MLSRVFIRGKCDGRHHRHRGKFQQNHRRIAAHQREYEGMSAVAIAFVNDEIVKVFIPDVERKLRRASETDMRGMFQ